MPLFCYAVTHVDGNEVRLLELFSRLDRAARRYLELLEHPNCPTDDDVATFMAELGYPGHDGTPESWGAIDHMLGLELSAHVIDEKKLTWRDLGISPALEKETRDTPGFKWVDPPCRHGGVYNSGPDGTMTCADCGQVI